MAEIVIVSPTDYMPYLSPLPEVGAGTVDPRHIAVSLSATLRRTRLVPGHVVGVDFTNHSITVAGPDGQRRELSWHRLVLTPGSVSRTLPLPGILEQIEYNHAVCFRAQHGITKDELISRLGGSP
jgi:NADH dehydrogenase